LTIKHDDRLDALSGAVGYWLKAMGRNVEIAKREHRRDLLEKKLKRHIENAQGRPIQRKTCVVHS
jgi:hypothetical protein